MDQYICEVCDEWRNPNLHGKNEDVINEGEFICDRCSEMEELEGQI